jgi:hypothetical protein
VIISARFGAIFSKMVFSGRITVDCQTAGEADGRKA